MRVSRHKKFQRYLAFFNQQFQFQAPYRILIDGTFANAVLATKVNMKEQLPKYFDGDCKLLVTPCTIIETEQLGPSVYGALQVLKGLQLHKCSHTDKAVPAADCLKSLARKIIPSKTPKSDEDDRHFVIATQDPNLREEFRKVIGIPIIYLHGNAPTMEKPSEASVKWTTKRDKKKVKVSSYQMEILQHIKDDLLPESATSSKGPKKRKRSGPNPLSCKKSKKQKGSTSSNQVSNSQQCQDAQPKKRKRFRLKIPKHVKELKQTV